MDGLGEHSNGVAATRADEERCELCGGRDGGDAVRLSVDNPQGEDAEVWRVCLTCYREAQAEVRRAGLRSRHRLRIALAVVASRRAPDSAGHGWPRAASPRRAVAGRSAHHLLARRACFAIALQAVIFALIALALTLHL